MELRHFRYFETLAGTLNFTRAAEKSHVTQSTLSHQIRHLEDELGVRLFDRIGKRVIITEAGEKLLNHITPVLRQIDDINGILREPTNVISGNLRIGATHSFTINLVPGCISVLLSRNPSIMVTVEELSGNAILERLDEELIDIGITYRPLTETDLHFEPLYNEELKLVVARDHPLARRKKVRMAELEGVRMTLLPEYFSTRKLLEECFLAANVKPLTVVELNTIAPMLEIIRRTDLAGIISEKIIVDASELCVIPLETPTPMRTPGLLWKRGRPQSEATKQFIVTVRRSVQQFA